MIDLTYYLFRATFLMSWLLSLLIIKKYHLKQFLYQGSYFLRRKSVLLHVVHYGCVKWSLIAKAFEIHFQTDTPPFCLNFNSQNYISAEGFFTQEFSFS